MKSLNLLFSSSPTMYMLLRNLCATLCLCVSLADVCID